MATTLTHQITVECASEAEAQNVKNVLEKYQFTAQGILYIDKNYNSGLVGTQLRKMITLKNPKKWL